MDSTHGITCHITVTPTITTTTTHTTNGAIDGALGDQTEAAIAHYQEDHDLSVTGTLTAATLQSLGLTAG
ncbi:MAG: hypothetical protein DME96_06530 [Verrucomicrobia bacterium]|nr:MAG: hypothetical protein DME96_06530 [Verrucomicrobiota bacterium]